jgi:hypothetical protein
MAARVSIAAASPEPERGRILGHPRDRAAHDAQQHLRLHRRTVDLAWLHTIGKETNRLDDIDAGIIGSIDEVTDYDRPAAAFVQLVLPALDQFTTQQLAELTGISKRHIARIRKTNTPPRHQQRQTLIRLAVDTALNTLDGTQPEHPWTGIWPHSANTQYESILSHWLAHRANLRLCPCNCGRELTRRQKYASDACRKRHTRRSRGSTTADGR